MAKRTATTELTHDNWDHEPPAEKAGTFQVASREEISQRIVKKAKRRLTEFSGFGSSPSIATVPKISFDFFKVKSDTALSSNGVPETQSVASPLLSNKKTAEAGNSRSEYLIQLCCLNECLVSWITQHVKKNPYVLLTPVFRDYNNHVEELEKKYKACSLKSKLIASQSATANKDKDDGLDVTKPSTSGDTTIMADISVTPSIVTPPMPNWIGICPKPFDVGGIKKGGNLETAVEVRNVDVSLLGSPTPPKMNLEAMEDNKPPTNEVQDAKENDPQCSKRMPNWIGTCAKPSDNGGIEKGGILERAAEAPSLAGTPNNSTSQAPNVEEREGDYQPPKNEVQEIKEKDALYSKRCKLFYKKDTSYVEKGIGNLYLKPFDGKTQLLFRAETNIGKILLNIRLTPDIPLQRVGKNNVSLICFSEDVGAVSTFLIRVKTAEDADELFAALDKHKL